MSGYVAQTKTQKPIVSVRVHNSPTLSTPRIPPTSPDMIPAFDYTYNATAIDSEQLVTKNPKSLQKSKYPVYLKSRNKEIVVNNPRKSKEKKFSNPQPSNMHSRSLHAPQLRIPLQLHKLKTSTLRKSTTLTNIGKGHPNHHIKQRRAYSSRNFDKTKGDDDVLKTFFDSEFPPYNPADFAPEEAKSEGSDEINNQMTKKEMSKVNYNQELLKKIRLELDEWMASGVSSEKKKCPEQWSSLPVECKEDNVTVPPITRPSPAIRLES